MSLTSELIAKFNLEVDDASELSSSEELDLANEIYLDVCNDRDWEFLKEVFTGSTSTSVDYVALPADFKKLVPNKDGISVVFVGTDYQEYKVVPFSSRRDYRNQDGFCYVDIPNQRMVFTKQPTSVKTIEYDYIKVPATLALSDEPIFSSSYHKIIYFGMAARFPIIEQTDKSISYRRENAELYANVLTDMQFEDTNIKLSI